MVRTLPQPAEPDWTGFWAAVVRSVEAARRPVPRPAGPRRFRWAVGGAVVAALAVSLTVWQLAPWELMTGPVRPDMAVVVRSAGTAAPNGSVMVYSPPERDLTVVWVFGLEQ
jgi:hypothetical protein